MNLKPIWICLGLGALAASLAILQSTNSHALHVKPVFAAEKPAGTAEAGWNSHAAERYLDSREVWWQSWEPAKRDHGTYCISCHTQMPYGLARPVLREALSEPDHSGAERTMLDSIEKRVRLWKQVEPFYPDGKYGPAQAVGSRNAESVLNALILTSYDLRQGHLSDTTKMAFDNAWALQSPTGPSAGAWIWQDFNLAPWESPESEYHGAALMAVAVGKAPDHYRDSKKIAPNMLLLINYLRGNFDDQPLLNKIAALWASARIPGIVTREQRSELLADLANRQLEDGGWTMSDLGSWDRVDGTPPENRSDGYATGFIVLALEENGVNDSHVKRGIQWLLANQDKSTGAWPSSSLNKNRDPNSDVGRFMSDAATGYAVLALEARR